MTIDTKNLRVLAEAALPAPWEAPDATVPYNSRRELKDAMTPTVVLELLDALERKDRLLRGCIGIMNSGPYMDAVLVRGAIEAITKEIGT